MELTGKRPSPAPTSTATVGFLLPAAARAVRRICAALQSIKWIAAVLIVSVAGLSSTRLHGRRSRRHHPPGRWLAFEASCYPPEARLPSRWRPAPAAVPYSLPQHDGIRPHHPTEAMSDRAGSPSPPLGPRGNDPLGYANASPLHLSRRAGDASRRTHRVTLAGRREGGRWQPSGSPRSSAPTTRRREGSWNCAPTH